MDAEKAIEWIERARDYFTPEFGDEAESGAEACEFAIQAIETLPKLSTLVEAAKHVCDSPNPELVMRRVAALQRALAALEE
jgi:hypothetical protein